MITVCSFRPWTAFQECVQGGTLLHWAAFAQHCQQDDQREVKEFGDLLAFALEHGTSQDYDQAKLSKASHALACDTYQRLQVAAVGANGDIGFLLYWHTMTLPL